MRINAAIAIIALTLANHLHADSLFSDPINLKSDPVWPALRSVEQTTNTAFLSDLKAGNKNSGILNLFPGDISYDFTLTTKTIYTSDSFSMLAQVDGQDDSYIWIGQSGSYLMGEVISEYDTKHFTIENLGNDKATITEFTTEVPFKCGFSTETLNGACNLLGDGVATSPTTIEVMYVLSKQVYDKVLDSHTLAILRCEEQVADANWIESRSQSMVRYHLADVIGTNYDEGPASDRDPNLVIPDDEMSALSEVRIARELKKVDVLAYMVEGGNSSDQVTGSEGVGSSIIFVYSLFGGGFNTAHEIGHVLGLGHTDQAGITAYARGFAFGPPVLGLEHTFETVMNDGVGLIPLHVRSNPDLRWPLFLTPLGMGQVLGDPDTADEVRLVNETVTHVAAYRGADIRTFKIKDQNGNIVAQILNTETVLLRGQVHMHASEAELSSGANTSSFIVKNQFDTVARLDGETGDLYCKDEAHFETFCIDEGTIPGWCFVLRNDDGSAVFGITTITFQGHTVQADLFATGPLIENWTGPWF